MDEQLTFDFENARPLRAIRNLDGRGSVRMSPRSIIRHSSVSVTEKK